jgi:hypothetical protein
MLTHAARGADGMMQQAMQPNDPALTARVVRV